ncbi:RloB family protein [Methylacidimicrobium sp. B4]|uniref:RloB family protein n=1 Tax=Methylacidimicrobium sp. B4 TaxID=2796139 RepID=UPI001A8ED471|nr:RloB family protein [Methylacidimicrobium sp. B4]QSR85410.1 RloB domain-containing protein [Methylacidimicrobium sp. B4]
MGSKRRSFRPPQGKRRYRKLYVIATEGAKTEPDYFSLALFRNRQLEYYLKLLPPGRRSSPAQVLERMSNHLRKEALQDSDEAWLVVDHDQRSDEELAPLFQWTKEACHYCVALSNPNFEYWLLLHFEDGEAKDCLRRLKKHLPGYDKGIRASAFSEEQIRDAVNRAKKRNSPPCTDWPRIPGSTVYLLVEKLLPPLAT